MFFLTKKIVADNKNASSYSELFAQVRAGQTGDVKRQVLALKKSGTDLKTVRDTDGASLVHAAAEFGNKPLLKFLAGGKVGLPLSLTDKQGRFSIDRVSKGSAGASVRDYFCWVRSRTLETRDWDMTIVRNEAGLIVTLQKCRNQVKDAVQLVVSRLLDKVGLNSDYKVIEVGAGVDSLRSVCPNRLGHLLVTEPMPERIETLKQAGGRTEVGDIDQLATWVRSGVLEKQDLLIARNVASNWLPGNHSKLIKGIQSILVGGGTVLVMEDSVPTLTWMTEVAIKDLAERGKPNMIAFPAASEESPLSIRFYQKDQLMGCVDSMGFAAIVSEQGKFEWINLIRNYVKNPTPDTLRQLVMISSDNWRAFITVLDTVFGPPESVPITTDIGTYAMTRLSASFQSVGLEVETGTMTETFHVPLSADKQLSARLVGGNLTRYRAHRSGGCAGPTQVYSLRYLIARKPVPDNLRRDYLTAARSGDIPAVQQKWVELRMAGIASHIPTGKAGGSTALHFAAGQNQANAVRELVRLGHPLVVQDKQGRRPIELVWGDARCPSVLAYFATLRKSQVTPYLSQSDTRVPALTSHARDRSHVQTVLREALSGLFIVAGIIGKDQGIDVGCGLGDMKANLPAPHNQTLYLSEMDPRIVAAAADAGRDIDALSLSQITNFVANGLLPRFGFCLAVNFLTANPPPLLPRLISQMKKVIQPGCPVVILTDSMPSESWMELMLGSYPGKCLIPGYGNFGREKRFKFYIFSQKKAVSLFARRQSGMPDGLSRHLSKIRSYIESRDIGEFWTYLKANGNVCTLINEWVTQLPSSNQPEGTVCIMEFAHEKMTAIFEAQGFYVTPHQLRQIRKLPRQDYHPPEYNIKGFVWGRTLYDKRNRVPDGEFLEMYSAPALVATRTS